ncbi:MAG: acetylesterase [Micrococcaceae bacterium]|nr:acetylesterase [Micrococcaceae bacterium]
MDPRPSAIGGYEDWPDFVRNSRTFHLGAAGRAFIPGIRQAAGTGGLPETGEVARYALAALGVPDLPPDPPRVERGQAFLVEGVRVTPLQWELPFGPSTSAFLLTPDEPAEVLPGVLWMHCHGGNKWLGAERLIDLGARNTPEAVAYRRRLYEGRAVASDLARTGMAVLVHDPFGWGSRRFLLEPAPRRTAEAVEAQRSQWAASGHVPSAAELYNAAAAEHENTVAKAAGLLGTSFGGMVAYDDLAALAVLRSLPGVDPLSVGTAGFSGGGGRALTLAALDTDLRACAVTGMMTTVSALFPAYLDAHSWLLATPGLAAAVDLPDLWAFAGAELLVQYAREDELFPLEGMQGADDRLLELSRRHAAGYTGSWHPGGHVMTTAMQAEVTAFLHRSLAV